MAEEAQLALLKQGVKAWNAWRIENPGARVDLREANLSEVCLGNADLHEANLYRANLSKADLRAADCTGSNLWAADLSRANLQDVNFTGANLREANLFQADLRRANLSSANLINSRLPGADLRAADLRKAYLLGAGFGDANLSAVDLSKTRDLSYTHFGGAILEHANLRGTSLSQANFSGANLRGANLCLARLSGVNLSRANLSEADLSGATLTVTLLVETDLTGANLTGCHIYGTSAWGLKLENAKQTDLVITPFGEPVITVDDIEVAQFVYLLLHNQKIRNVIDTIGRKGVLLLGRFTEGRIEVLERLRAKLRELGFVPIVFNFDKPETKDFTETVRLLAGLSHFVIVDITNPRSAPLELQATVPNCMVPFVPILQKGEEPFAMLADLWIKHREWVLDPIRYSSVDRLIEILEIEIVQPAQTRFKTLVMMKAEQLRIRDF